LECTLFIGRNLDSPGMLRAKELGVRVSEHRIEAILNDADCCDLVFDATSAQDHMYHWPLLQKIKKRVIDMTPSQVGRTVVPAIGLNGILEYQNVNMVSCGGQASIPLAYVIMQMHKDIEYIEVVSSIASKSAGPATRINIDEYVENTEKGLRFFTGCQRVKAILILNPAQPCIDMQTTVSIKMQQSDMEKIRVLIANMEKRIKSYVPGYKIIVPPVYENNRVVIIVRVQGLGDYLPVYAGNLDIINCAAIATAEEYARRNNDKAEELNKKYATNINY
jgi:acetaldehyde dehydrogenase